ncbi:Sarcosine oxidase alpha subunit [hydrothermal vent metagenome]|uniref:Sarcosine oxidase alpha subunit n=1 Tax=hydrothermal vent metagenome TaxID=652676 RepID=A0A3B0V3K8_9ZZZZ
MSKQSKNRRIAAQPNELIDRTRTIKFTFNGKTYPAHPGDSIASALAANGVSVIGRSFKYHRPRGLHGFGNSANTTLQIGDDPSVDAWLRPLQDGLAIESVNAWPSLEQDVMSLAQMGSRFMPVGFYYKTFIRPQRLWPMYEMALRKAAGLGKLNIDAPLEKGYVKQYLHGDVVIVGAGPAGLSAAKAAADTGAQVLLFEEAAYLGGHLRYASEKLVEPVETNGLRQDQATSLLEAVAAHENIRVFTDALVAGWFEAHWLSALSGKTLYKIRGRATIFATGAVDQPLIFENNDLPGIMLGSTAQRLLHLYGVAPGDKVLVVTANEDGWQLAQDLKNVGIDVVGLVDHRASRDGLQTAVSHQDIPTFWQHTVVKAYGKKRVVAADIAPINQLTKQHNIACDTILICTAWAADNKLATLAGVKFAFDEDRREFMPASVPDGIFLAGRVAGTHGLALQIDEGALAGQQAAAYLGYCQPPDSDEETAVTHQKNNEPTRSSSLIYVAGDKKGKRFVDLDEDVTDKDIQNAIAEGYNSMQLLKRYSTLSMGPSQGRWSSVNAIHLAAKATEQSIAQTGTTTFRPPVRPVKLANLAGQMMEPVKVTPLHDWHLARGAKMMEAGVWLRPEFYGETAVEIKAVRERVGLIDISTLGKIKLTGPGVPALLNKLYINKFAKLKVGRVRYGVMVNDEGIVMDDGVTAHVDEYEWYMTTTSGGADTVYEWIQWWVQSGWGDGVHVTNVTEERTAFNLAGPRARDLLEKLTDGDLSNEVFPYMGYQELEISRIPCRLMRIGFTGELSYEIHAPAGYGRSLWETIMNAGESFNILPFGVEAQRILRLEKGHIIIGADTDALSDPFGAELGWAVKLDKDDFLGKRVLSQIAEDGPKSQLVGFTMVNAGIVPEEGLQIVQPKANTPLGLETIGWISSSRYSPTLNASIGLCWLPPKLAAQVGATITIRRNGELVEAKVHHGAFYDPDGKKLRGSVVKTRKGNNRL